MRKINFFTGTIIYLLLVADFSFAEMEVVDVKLGKEKIFYGKND